LKRTIQFKILAFICLLLCAGTWLWLDKKMQKLQEKTATGFVVSESQLPDLKIPALNTESDFALTIDNSSTIVFNFWASWCAPCLEELPALLKAVEQQNQTKGSDRQTRLVLVNVDDDAAMGQRILARFDTEKPWLISGRDREKQLAKIFGTSQLPETYIFKSPDWKLKQKIAGSVAWENEPFYTMLE